MPYLFSDEGHERVEEAKGALEDCDQGCEGCGGGLFVIVVAKVEAELDDFEVPVAEVAPEELVDGVGGFVEEVVREGFVD